MTLYAQWDVITYYIAFDANGGSGSMSTISLTYGEERNLPECQFTLEDGKFAGWAISEEDAENNIITYEDQAQVENLSYENGDTVTLYAVWYTNIVNYVYLNSGSTTVMTHSEYVGTKYEKWTPDVSKVSSLEEGYEFIGWSPYTSISHSWKSNSEAGQIVEFPNSKTSITWYAVYLNNSEAYYHNPSQKTYSSYYYSDTIPIYMDPYKNKYSDYTMKTDYYDEEDNDVTGWKDDDGNYYSPGEYVTTLTGYTDFYEYYN